VIRGADETQLTVPTIIRRVMAKAMNRFVRTIFIAVLLSSVVCSKRVGAMNTNRAGLGDVPRGEEGIAAGQKLGPEEKSGWDREVGHCWR
jgi:hypothetical protein